MALIPGTRLGPYEILSPIGAGGMGEVYRARDTRLGRDVALKILPEDRAFDPDRLRRFETEARAVASLNHPHILALYDVGTHDGVPYAVTELLEGRTLRSVLEKGPLPARKVVDYGVQICRGLAAAHERGVIHRDLKPQNVFVTRDGRVKILDFGLAKLTGPGEGELADSEGPTATEPGVVMGTAAYMSPEQARGRPADARSDLFSLGAILYEMLSGRGPFWRTSRADTLAAIIKEDPPSLETPSSAVPSALGRVVLRCLEKAPDERLQSARDLAFALEAVSGPPTPSIEKDPGTPLSGVGAILVAGAAAAALLLGILAGRLWTGATIDRPELRVVRSQIDLTESWPLRSPWTREWPATRNHPVRTELALSPDGSRLVWTSRPDDDPHASVLRVRRLDTGEVALLSGTEGGFGPFFSPDGEWIGFTTGLFPGKARLGKVRIEGGLPVDLGELSFWPVGACWGPDDTIFLGADTGGIYSIPAEGGGTAVAVTTVDGTREVSHRLPRVLPGGRTLLFTAMPHTGGDRGRVEAVSLPSGVRKVLVEDGADARYLPTGHLVFVRRGVLMAAPFDLDRLELGAPPVPVVHGVSQALNSWHTGANSGAAAFAVSDSGLLAYAQGTTFPSTQTDLLFLDEAGHSEPLPGFERAFASPQVRYSPDGRQLAFNEHEPSGLLGIHDVDRHTDRLLSDAGMATSSAWSPDGTRLVVSWSEGGPTRLWLVPTENGGWEPVTDAGDGHGDIAPTWSSDGRSLAFVRLGETSDIFIHRFEDSATIPFLATAAAEGFPEFSPDGRWLAYGSNRSGRWEVYVTSMPDRERTLTVSQGGGMAPAWSRDGRNLFYYRYVSGSQEREVEMMAVDLHWKPGLSLGPPRVAFRLPESFFVLIPMRGYEVHPDGRHFVVGRLVQAAPTAPITHLELVQNWFTELERLSPIHH